MRDQQNKVTSSGSSGYFLKKLNRTVARIEKNGEIFQVLSRYAHVDADIDLDIDVDIDIDM